MRVGESIRRLARPAFLCAVLALTQVSCGDSRAVDAGAIDYAAEAVPFAKPELDPLYRLPGASGLPDVMQRTLAVRRAFFAHRFEIPELALTLAHDDHLKGRSGKFAAGRIIDSIQDTQLAGIDACADWLRQMPDSYAAHWLCGAMWEGGAWAARSKKFSSEVSAARFAIMNERLQRSNALLERAITLTPEPLEALVLLAENRYLDGDKTGAEALLERAGEIRPDYPSIHWTRLNYAQPKWGGSEERVKAAFERAKQAGVSGDRLLDMEDAFIVRPSTMTNPGEARAYWERVIREHPTRARLTALRNDLFWAQSWDAALPVATRLIAEYPGDATDHYWRARIHQQLGRVAEARDDYRMAAAMGDDLALQELVMANIRGGLGVTAKSFDEVVLLCRYGASLGSGVGANCMGSLFFEGGSAGVPFRHDSAQAFAWHLVGARAGHYNSQYDLGWMLYTERGPGVEAATAKRLGTFWLRRAAEQDHAFAKRKLEENGISPSENLASGLLERLGLGMLSAYVHW